MSGLNLVVIEGRLGQDPDMKYTAAGKAIANLSIATSESWKDKQTGEKQEKTEWHRVVIFGPAAEVAGNHQGKGSAVLIRGKLQTRKWEDNDGNTRYSTEVVADMYGGLVLIEKSSGGNQQSGQGGFRASPEQAYGGTPKGGPAQGELGNNDFADDEIPF
jgi:single-strand DNA-binding protein